LGAACSITRRRIELILANRDWLLDWTVEAADNGLAPIGREWNIRGVDLAVSHLLKSANLASLTAIVPHIPHSRAVAFRAEINSITCRLSSSSQVWATITTTPETIPSVCHLSSLPTNRS
jgi:hypothetical protein